MKNSLVSSFVFLLIAFSSNAQTLISGIVYDTSYAPIPYASIYLSKTTVGVMADDKGAYAITVPQDGKYVLIASRIGFKSQSQIIKADGTNKVTNIKLSVQPVLIQEVTIKDKDRNHRKNYELFLKCFIGETPNAPFCTIENPKDLIVYLESSGRNLIAYSVKPLIITNSSFGYKIIYDLKSFSYDISKEHLRFSGDYYFKDISNQKSANSRYKRNRLIAYYGSRMHFLRALFTGSVSQEQFEMCNIELDSCGTKILTNSLHEDDLRFAIQSDSMTIYHFYPVLIHYTDNHPELFPLPYIYDQKNYTSRIIFTDTLHVYNNGYYPESYNVSWGGNMSGDRIAEMLPFDFVP